MFLWEYSVWCLHKLYEYFRFGATPRGVNLADHLGSELNLNWGEPQ